LDCQCIDESEKDFQIFTNPRRAEKSARKVEDINVAFRAFSTGLKRILIEEMNSAPQKHINSTLFHLSTVRGTLKKPKSLKREANST